MQRMKYKYVPSIHMVVEPPWSMLIACVQLNTCQYVRIL